MQLKTLANELHEQAVASFKVSERFAYDFIMKVKRIRDERLYKELGHDSFESYCEDAWSIKRDYMDQRIQIADSFGEENFADTYRQIGHSKSLLLARVEPEVRQKIESMIDVNSSSFQELREVKKSLQAAEQRAVKAENESRHWQGVAQSARNQQPRVETRTVEKIPATIEKELEDLRFKAAQYKAGYEEAKSQLDQYKIQDTVDFDEKQSELQRKKLQHEADLNTINLRITYKQFIEKASVSGFMQGAIASASQGEKERLAEMVESAQQIINQTKSALNGRRLGVVNG